MPVILPLHPRTQSRLQQNKTLNWLASITPLEPVPYLEMQRLVMSAHVILTDSGGMQKEAYFHQVPCITLRDETEWVETVISGQNHLAGAATECILNLYQNINLFSSKIKPYFGEGASASKMLKLLESDIGCNSYPQCSTKTHVKNHDKIMKHFC